MDPESWRQIDQLLEAALERRPEERAAFLAIAYAGLGSVWLTCGDVGFLPPREAFLKATSYQAKAIEAK
jgi:hypothetical protein